MQPHIMDMVIIRIVCNNDNYNGILYPTFNFNAPIKFSGQNYSDTDYHDCIKKHALEAIHHRAMFGTKMYLSVASDDRVIESEFSEVKGVYMFGEYEQISFTNDDLKKRWNVGDIIGKTPFGKVNLILTWGIPPISREPDIFRRA